MQTNKALASFKLGVIFGGFSNSVIFIFDHCMRRIQDNMLDNLQIYLKGIQLSIEIEENIY